MVESSLLKKIVYLITFVVSYLIVLVYGVCFLCRVIKRWVTNPSDRFWLVKDRELPPECLNDPAFGNHAYVQVKNMKLHYVEKGDRSKPLMLCLHGFPEFWYSWRHQLKEFSSDYWVVAVDMRGYGDSEKPAGRENYIIDHLVADVKHLIAALGKEKCTLVAHDWGGIIAWYFVLLEPQAIDSYIIMNSAHPIAFRTVLNKSLRQFKSSWYVFFFQLPYLPEMMCRMNDLAFLEKAFTTNQATTALTETDLEAYKFTFGKPGALTFPINYYRANFLLRSRNRLQDLGKTEDFPPGLVLYGEGDIFLQREVQEESAKMVTNARVVYIKHANHFVQQDNPEAVNKEMRQFFSEVKVKEKL